MTITKAYAYSMVLLATGEVVSAGVVGVTGSPSESTVINSIVRDALLKGTILDGDVVDVQLVYADEGIFEPLRDLMASTTADSEFLRQCGIGEEN